MRKGSIHEWRNKSKLLANVHKGTYKINYEKAELSEVINWNRRMSREYRILVEGGDN